MTAFDFFDLCQASILTIDSQQNIVHANQHCQSLAADLGLTLGTQEPLKRYLQSPLSDDDWQRERFKMTMGDELFGVVAKPLNHDGHDYRVLTLTRIGAQQQLKAQLLQFQQNMDAGCLDCPIEISANKGMAAEVALRINSSMHQLKEHLATFNAAVGALAECDLRVNLGTTQLGGYLGELETRLAVTVSNLSESIRQTIVSSQAIAHTTADIVEQNRLLLTRTLEQADAIQHTSANMEELSGAVASAAENAEKANQQGTETAGLADSGRDAVAQVVEAMDRISHSSEQIREITKLIHSISFQTNILALNAAVEAARAGEHGRGFNIVATEVRSLASRSAEAADRIQDLIDQSVQITANGKKLASDASERMESIVEGVRKTSEQIQAISIAAGEQKVGIHDANEALTRIDVLTQNNRQLVAEISQNTEELEQQSRYMSDSAGVFFLPEDELTHPLHHLAREHAVASAKQVATVMAAHIQQRRIAHSTLFDFSYHPIPDTNPLKHSTAFDRLCDEILPPIQETLLQDYPDFVYAIAADLNGYVPTHNDRFCQALTGDPQKDLAGNRTKRIFNDRVGLQVGRHTEAYKLQIYRRDTGELMFDMSAPIYVDGEHWGGFRIGYRIT